MHVLDFMHAFLHGLSSQNYIAKLELSINVNQRFLVQILTTKDCKGQQTNVCEERRIYKDLICKNEK